jgi:peptidoglycan/xylan/chitin deacetylase (PgdA/CDA1 family)
LAAVARPLVRFGSHTVTHPRLECLDGEELDWQLRESRAVLRAITGGDVEMLALPFGSYAPHVLRAAGRAGYKYVFANVPIRRSEKSESGCLVGRVDVSPSDWLPEFRLKLVGGYDWMSLVSPLKRSVVEGLRRIPASDR